MATEEERGAEAERFHRIDDAFHTVDDGLPPLIAALSCTREGRGQWGSESFGLRCAHLGLSHAPGGR